MPAVSFADFVAFVALALTFAFSLALWLAVRHFQAVAVRAGRYYSLSF